LIFLDYFYKTERSPALKLWPKIIKAPKRELKKSLTEKLLI